jgi:FtsP/CotA-like multicopper oxidase with cupredoxin domain
MLTQKVLNRLFLILMLASLLLSGGVPALRPTTALAMPGGPTDETKVPHYFGPYANWANSPFTLPAVAVTITDPGGIGVGATAVATVGADGAVTGITITNPGSGYTAADVTITGAGNGATATAAVAGSGAVIAVNVTANGTGYTAPIVTFNGVLGAGRLVQVGNRLADRALVAGSAVEGTQGSVFVIVPKALPTGTLTEFLSWNQAAASGGPALSAEDSRATAGNTFVAYVLRPTGMPNEYTIVYSSETLAVPPLANPAVSERIAYPVGKVDVQAGDVLAFYGTGIPYDTAAGATIEGAGVDIASYAAPDALVQGATITVGDPATFPLVQEARTYSFAASVIDSGGSVDFVSATATAYGSVDVLTLTNGGTGYTFPTVDFDWPDAPDGVQATGHALFDPATGVITSVVLDNPGSGYATAPGVVIRDGTLWDPINNGGSGATASATIKITSVTVDTPGDGYTTAPIVGFTDPTGTGAAATAVIAAGAVTTITLTAPGTGYVTPGGIQKFVDGLPTLCIPAAGQTFADCASNNLGQHIPIAIPDITTFTTANGFAANADYYVIAVVQHREQMNSSLPITGTLLREYVQLETPANAAVSKHVALQTDLLDGTSIPTLMPDGSQAYAVDDPHFLGPIIAATKDRPVRVVFYNLLPTGVAGNLFLPVDTTLMGSGMGPMDMMPPMDSGTVTDTVRNPMCTDDPQAIDPMTGMPACFKNNRATVHLHGGISPWISDGTPHQWITPANENTPWPQGVEVGTVPDMARPDLGVPDCSGTTDGCMSFYYTNQQSARLLFYHDHAWGITRLNVYAGEAAGYLITDATEQTLISSGKIPGPADTIPLVIQDRTFVPQGDPVTRTGQLYEQDPTWDESRWGGYGNLWYHHVYMPAQNPGDPSGMSAYGRWMYGPWFWPPAGTAQYQPIANPYYNPACNLDDPATWQYQTDPFCEPQLIPGTPNISVGMEQFNDTPIVNGTAYPTLNLEPKAYRFRILSVANDRFFNFQWYVADPRTASTALNAAGQPIGGTEVALNAAELAAAQTDPNVFPTPDTAISPPGPSWIQIGTEGGFLPAPNVVPNQPITWIIDPTRFDVGNVDLHSLLLAPAERADVIVDFSKFAGQTLILYNDAPAAFPARVASYDYYTGAPDMTGVGAPAILPGYGPNTRTVMQVKIAANPPAPAFNLRALQNAFKHHADGSGVFESGQNPIIVGQAAYNSAYGTNFAASSWCNNPQAPINRCDGFARISEQGGDMFGFNTLVKPNTKELVRLEPKAIHDEMNASAFDEFGRMTANLGLEVVPATPAGQNIVLYPFVNPPTELIDGTNLPRADVKVTPIAGPDGTQIWKITHNGVDTHPIHFHLFDVQILNRVTWDNIIIPTDPGELGWKDTIRVSPLEDTIVAVRPAIPIVPFELPNSIRMLNPMMPAGDTTMFNNIDAAGNPTTPIVNQLVNFGLAYMYHCHILSHEEMDMMRPVSVAMPPSAPSGLAWTVSGNGPNQVLTLTWNDNSINETSFVVQKSDGSGTWVDAGTVVSPLDQPNVHGSRIFTDTTYASQPTMVLYQVVAQNTIGYGGEFMSLTAKSVSGQVVAILPPTNLVAALQAGPQVGLTWRDNTAIETGYTVERSTDGVNFSPVGTTPPGTGNIKWVDTAVTPGTTYTYRVLATSAVGPSAYSNTAQVVVPPAPAVPTSLTAVNGANPPNNTRIVILNWTANTTNVTSFTIQRATNPGFTAGLVTYSSPATAFTRTVTGLARNTAYYFRIRANNGPYVWSAYLNATPFPIVTNP